jgi:DNA-binding response OmpR family regulator
MMSPMSNWVYKTSSRKGSSIIKGRIFETTVGANDYITKPFTRAQLLFGIQWMFEEKSESLPVGRQE